jgi:cob(I)alamin adenosyltransferase
MENGSQMPENITDSIGKGYIQIYTGNCKGKTTAALGLAFRAMGHGLKTYIGQFIKKHPYGEIESARMVSPYITIEQYGRGAFIHVSETISPEDIECARKGLATAIEAMMSGQYSIIVLDEILTACHFKLISQADILKIMSDKPCGVELVLTGRYAPADIIEAADLVTEMTEVKHYYQKGVPARPGIER